MSYRDRLPSRRVFLKLCPTATLLTCGISAAPAGRRSLPAAHSGVDLAKLAKLFREASREACPALAAKAIVAGVGLDTILGASLLAGVQEIEPRPVGYKLHALMVVESTFQLAAASSPDEAWIAALWNLDSVKRAQLSDARENDWQLGKRPEVSYFDGAAALKDFELAMAEWDDDRADRGIVGIYEHFDRDAVWEILWPYGIRCFASLGHKPIYLTQFERVLRRIDWKYAEPLLRSLVRGLLYGGKSGAVLDTYASGHERLPKLRRDWETGREDSQQSEELLRGLRSCSAVEAQDLVIATLTEGFGPATVWDALRLYASEIFLRRPELLPVHAVTETCAFGYVFRTAKNPTTRGAAMLQAAGWLPLLRDTLAARRKLDMKRPGLDVLGRGCEIRPLATAMANKSADDVAAALAQDPQRQWECMARLRRNLFTKADGHHEFKYAAAVQEESRLVHPRFSGRILAPAVEYLPGDSAPDTGVCKTSRAALRKAGVL